MDVRFPGSRLPIISLIWCGTHFVFMLRVFSYRDTWEIVALECWRSPSATVSYCSQLFRLGLRWGGQVLHLAIFLGGDRDLLFPFFTEFSFMFDSPILSHWRSLICVICFGDYRNTLLPICLIFAISQAILLVLVVSVAFSVSPDCPLFIVTYPFPICSLSWFFFEDSTCFGPVRNCHSSRMGGSGRVPFCVTLRVRLLSRSLDTSHWPHIFAPE